MKRIILSFLCIAGTIFGANAQLNVSAANTTYTINFDGTVSGVTQGGYAGKGFSPNPVNGELDSDAWEIDEDGTILNFGGTQNTSGSTFAKGVSTGGSGSTGFQAYEVAPGDTAFGIQPTGGTFTPGYITLKVQNNTGAVITEFDVTYEVYIYNDNDRGNQFNFAYSTNNSVFTNVSALDFTSPGTQDPSPTWVSTPKNNTITGLNIPDSSFFYLRWTGADDTGSGSRDEFAIDDISVTVTTGVPNDVTPHL